MERTQNKPEPLRWEGRVFGLFRVVNTRAALTSQRLTIWRWGFPFHTGLQEIQNVRVRRRPLDRLCGTGTLFIDRAGRPPLRLRGLRNPYEGWKQIKIAVFESRKGP